MKTENRFVASKLAKKEKIISARILYRKKKPSRRKAQQSVLAKRIKKSLFWVVLALLLIFLLGTSPLRDSGLRAPQENIDFIRFISVCVRPFFMVFGRAAYSIPFFLLFFGISQLWDRFYLKRHRNAIRAIFSIPLLAILDAGLGRLLSRASDQGGIIGIYYFRYITNVGGSILGWVGGMLILLFVGSILWGFTLPYKKGYRVLIKALKKGMSFLIKTVQTARYREKTREVFSAGDAEQRIDPSPGKDLQGWRPTVFGPPSSPGGALPLRPFPSENTDSETRESSYLPLPEPDYQTPLPLEILPDPVISTKERDQLYTNLELLQKEVVKAIRRTAGIDLAPTKKSPHVGLNSIAFTFSRTDTRCIPVRNIDKAIEDIGLSTGRSPARIRVGAMVQVELPLFERERCFVPIKAILQEILSPGSIGPETYLIGRNQDGMPLELNIRDARHLLVGGGTGGGKTVLLHAIIFGLLFRYSPSRIRLALVDFKVFEFLWYKGLPHLWHELVTTPSGFSTLIENLWMELQSRKNEILKNPDVDFPILLIIIDEFAGYDSQKLIRLIAQGRALNMFFILATQHPVHEVISSGIKANLMTSIATQTKLKSGSQLIIGSSDAVSLQSKGDCLILSESGLLTRAQAAWVTNPKDIKNSDLEALGRFLKTLRPAAPTSL